MNVNPKPSFGLKEAFDPEHFDMKSGSLLERLIFNHRRWFILFCFVITAILGFYASQIGISASYKKTLPQSSPYIQNYLKYQEQLPQLGNLVRIVVQSNTGTIYDPEYQEALHDVYNKLAGIPGVFAAGIRSLWSPNVRYIEVTKHGFVGGPVMPPDYDGSPGSMRKLRDNIISAGLVGQLVSNDLTSSMLVIPLVEENPQTGQPLDYHKFTNELNKQIRPLGDGNVTIRIVGFAQLQGVLIDGVGEIMGFFAFAIALIALIIFIYTRCVRSTLILLACSCVAIVWELGLIKLLGFNLNPYSVLVPFLIFAIGVSHGAQKMNGIMQDIGRGASKLIAARYTFRRIFIAGLTALVADSVGFAVLLMIDIPVIREMSLIASLGVFVLIFTNLLLLPVTLSFTGVSKKAIERSLHSENNYGKNVGLDKVWYVLSCLTERRWAIPACIVGLAIFVLGFVGSQYLVIGSTVPGAPALWPDSQYNQDVAYISNHYGLSTDLFAVLIKTPKNGCARYRTLIAMDRLSEDLTQIPGVQYTNSLARRMRQAISQSFEGNPKWLTIPPDQAVLNPISFRVTKVMGTLTNKACSVSPVSIYLNNHKADLLNEVLGTVEQFTVQHDSPDMQVLPVAGSAGVQAVTNRAIKHADSTMMYYLYAAVILLCLISFRSWRATIVAVIPLVITAFLCEALMALLGIGVKTSTLPVIALGVGVGVDYALYLLSVQLAEQRNGLPLKEAYHAAAHFTGKVVALVGVTLAAGVIFWLMAPIKFQADMGLLLVFMFLWNMVGALLLIPALSHFLLRDIGPEGEKGSNTPNPGKTAC